MTKTEHIKSLTDEVRRKERAVSEAEEGLEGAEDELKEAKLALKEEQDGFHLTVADAIALEGRFNAIDEFDPRWRDREKIRNSKEPITLKIMMDFFAE